MSDDHEDGATTIEGVVSELHRRGVERGEREYERRVAEAREQAAVIVAEATARQEVLVEEGRREAERLVESAHSEADQLLQSFLGSLPDMFARRASQLLEALLEQSFAASNENDTVKDYVNSLGSDGISGLKSYLDSAEPGNFVEALLILAVYHYAGTEGFTTFQIDPALQSRLARWLADPAVEPAIQFEFRDGIRGFRVTGQDGREVDVSPESFRHMAEAWAGDEFRQVFSRLQAETHD